MTQTPIEVAEWLVAHGKRHSPWSDRYADAASTIRAQAAEIERLRGVVQTSIDAVDATRNGGILPNFEAWERDARQALTGKDAGHV